MTRNFPSKLDQIPTLPKAELQAWLDVIVPPRESDARIHRAPQPGEVAALFRRAQELGVALDTRAERRPAWEV
jgi:hypothetical protein